MRRLSTAIAALCLVSAAPAVAATGGTEYVPDDHPCDGKYVVTREIADCMDQALEKADRSLNEIYGFVMRELSAGQNSPYTRHFEAKKTSAFEEAVRNFSRQSGVETVLGSQRRKTSL